MHANLTEDEARVTLEALAMPEKALTADDKQLYHTATAKMELSIQSRAQTWHKHLIEQGVHPDIAKQHVRHRFGEVVL